jgi:hypothetical protein
MFKYRYVHDVSVVFTELCVTPTRGDEFESETPINHPYWELIATEAPKPKPTDEVIEIESPVVSADITKE